MFRSTSSLGSLRYPGQMEKPAAVASNQLDSFHSRNVDVGKIEGEGEGEEQETEDEAKRKNLIL
jgi:hypothetical protein